MESETDLLQVEKRIRGRVKKQMEKSQRDYYLNEQIKAIQKELGDSENGGIDEIEQLRQKLEEARLPREAKEKVEAEEFCWRDQFRLSLDSERAESVSCV